MMKASIHLEINQGISITHNYNASHMYGCQRDLPLGKNQQILFKNLDVDLTGELIHLFFFYIKMPDYCFVSAIQLPFIYAFEGHLSF